MTSSVSGIQFDEDGRVLQEGGDPNDAIVKAALHILTHDGYENEIRYFLITKLARDWEPRKTNGNYRGVPYWSEQALAKYQQIYTRKNGKLTEIDDECKEYFRHEHVLPVKACTELFNAKAGQIPPEFVAEVFYNHLNTAIILKSEDKLINTKYKDSMPESFKETGNIFNRYTEFGIKVKFVKWDAHNTQILGVKDMDPDSTVVENFVQHMAEDSQEQINANLEEFLSGFVTDPVTFAEKWGFKKPESNES